MTDESGRRLWGGGERKAQKWGFFKSFLAHTKYFALGQVFAPDMAENEVQLQWRDLTTSKETENKTQTAQYPSLIKQYLGRAVTKML